MFYSEEAPMKSHALVFVLALAVVAAAVILMPTAANAQGPAVSPYVAWGYYGPYPYLGSVNQPKIPYYALYPPVYYSYPVARPYGYSPFALPPGVEPVEPQEPMAEEIINPFYRAKGNDSEAKSPEDNGNRSASGTPAKTASLRRTIINPHVPR
jgi:hypothetical protein